MEFGSNKHNAPLRKANGLLHDALIELGKSDWVSVEDGLPEYCEKVFAYDKEMQDYPFVTMRYKAGKEKLIDKMDLEVDYMSLIGNLLKSWRSKYGMVSS